MHDYRNKADKMSNIFTLKSKRTLKSANLGYAVPLSLDEKFLIIEKDPNWRVIDLPIDRDPEMLEEVLVERLQDGTFRIASSPGMVMGLAADDIIADDCEMSQFPTRADFRFSIQMHMNFRMGKHCLPRRG